MAGKKKITYPMKIRIKTGEPVFFCNANDKYALHKDIVDKVLEGLNGTFNVGYVVRERALKHGINANSLNDAIRSKLAQIPDIEGETDVVFGSFLPPLHSKGEFDFSVVDKASNFYMFWNHCYGQNSVRNGEELVDLYIKDDKTKKEWNVFIEREKPRTYEDVLKVPESAFNLIGEIQFGNWAMVYKDMFRLVSAINKEAKIDLYIYVVAKGDLLTLMSDNVVGLDDACKRFKENTDNHNINKPVMIIPLDLCEPIADIDFSEAEEGYACVLDKLAKLDKQIIKTQDELKKIKELYKNDKSVEIKAQRDKLSKKKKKLENERDELRNQYKNQDEFDEDTD